MKKSVIFIIALILILAVGGYKINQTINEKNKMNNSTKVKLETNYGNIVINLYDDMPVTTGNFKGLIEQGVYNGVIFHRIIDGFMIQGGDPTGTGMGDPKIPSIQDEFTHSGGNKNNRGTISMANAGPNTGSSQFFINLVDNNFLDTKHPAFGKVIEGMDVVDKIVSQKRDGKDNPIEKIEMKKVEIIEE